MRQAGQRFLTVFYGDEGSRATDEYKEAMYYKHMREWTNKEGISCFYFEIFDEPWKDSKKPYGIGEPLWTDHG